MLFNAPLRMQVLRGALSKCHHALTPLRHFRRPADNSVGKIIDTLIRNDLLSIDEVGFAP